MLPIASSNFRWVAIDPPMMMARRLRGFDLGFQPVQKTPTIHVISGFIWGIPVMTTNGHARGARRVEGTAITDLSPLAHSLDTYARQIHSIAEIIRVIEEESAEQSTAAKAAENTAPCSPHDGQQHITSSTEAKAAENTAPCSPHD